MKVTDFDYELPKELIAQHPMEPRDHSRLLVVDKVTGETEHCHFYDLINYLPVSYTHLIGSVKGTVTYLEPEFCLIETAGGVGYRVFMPASQPVSYTHLLYGIWTNLRKSVM